MPGKNLYKALLFSLAGALLVGGCTDQGNMNMTLKNVLEAIPIGKLSDEDASVEYLRAICPANQAFGELRSAMIDAGPDSLPDARLESFASKAEQANIASADKLESIIHRWPISSREYIKQIINQQRLEAKVLGYYISPTAYQLDAISRNAYTGPSQALTTSGLEKSIKQIYNQYNPNPSTIVRMKLNISSVGC